MWTISELKERGKFAFKRNYWKCVLAALVIMVLGSGISGNGSDSSSSQEEIGPGMTFEQFLENHEIPEDEMEAETEEFQKEVEGYSSQVLNAGIAAFNRLGGFFGGFLPAGISSAVSGLVLGVVSLLMVVLAFFVLIFNIVITNVFKVGGCRFFVKNSYEPLRARELFWGFKEGRYVNIVLTMFLRGLFIVLWTFVFIIPGIIKSFEYRMVPYILAEEPDIPWRVALEKSKQMMYGHKMNSFILDLSFIGWELLSAITGGIFGIFYVNPYYYATDAELYLALNGGFEGYARPSFYVNVPMQDVYQQNGEPYSDYQKRWQEAYDNGTDWEAQPDYNEEIVQNPGPDFEDDRTYR